MTRAMALLALGLGPPLVTEEEKREEKR